MNQPATAIPLSPQGRVSFPEVFVPKAMEEGQKEKFSLTLLFDPAKMDDAQKAKLRAMYDAADKAAKEKFQVGLKELYKGKALTSPFRKSEEKPDLYDPGLIFVKFSSLVKPGLVDASRQPIGETTGDFYAGCWAHVTYTVYAYDQSGNRGVAFGLKNIQKTKDDDSFGGVRTTPEQDFDVLQEAASSGAADGFEF